MEAQEEKAVHHYREKREEHPFLLVVGEEEVHPFLLEVEGEEEHPFQLAVEGEEELPFLLGVVEGEVELPFLLEVEVEEVELLQPLWSLAGGAEVGELEVLLAEEVEEVVEDLYLLRWLEEVVAVVEGLMSETMEEVVAEVAVVHLLTSKVAEVGVEAEVHFLTLQQLEEEEVGVGV